MAHMLLLIVTVVVDWNLECNVQCFCYVFLQNETRMKDEHGRCSLKHLAVEVSHSSDLVVPALTAWVVSVYW